MAIWSNYIGFSTAFIAWNCQFLHTGIIIIIIIIIIISSSSSSKPILFSGILKSIF